MKRIALVASFLAAGLVLALPVTFVPRQNGNTALLFTQTLPTTTSPLPDTIGTGSCYGCQGQSVSVPGALHLNTCTRYQITLTATSGTLNGVGTVKIENWPDFGSPTNWARNASLDETVPASAAGQASITFLAHDAFGTGWIYAAPAGVTASAGTTVNVLIEAVCAY